MNRLGALDDDGLADNLQRFLHAAELREPTGHIELLAIQIFDVGRHVGRAPGDEPIAPERDGRCAGQRRTDDVEVARRQMGEIPDRWQSRAEMRIVGEQRPPAGRERAVDHPVVRAKRLGRRATEQEVADRGIAGGEARRKGTGPGTIVST